MSVWAVIPVKPLNRAKSRLTEVLSPDQRYELAQSMLKQVLTVVTRAPEIAGTVVISRDTKALAIARDMGARTIQESNPSDLNPALTRATEVIRVWGAQAVVVVPADLPFITTSDLSEIIRMGQQGPCVIMATDRNQDGTNALFMRPPGVIDFSYGPRSFERHISAARDAGIPYYFYKSESLTLDIDEPSDLIEYNRMVSNGQYNFLNILQTNPL